jgi:CBS domain-containing protein
MTADPLRMAEDAPIGTAIAVMAARTIRHRPVVDAREAVVGIVTDRDAVKVVPRQMPPICRPDLSW